MRAQAKWIAFGAIALAVAGVAYYFFNNLTVTVVNESGARVTGRFELFEGDSTGGHMAAARRAIHVDANASDAMHVVILFGREFTLHVALDDGRVASWPVHRPDADHAGVRVGVTREAITIAQAIP